MWTIFGFIAAFLTSAAFLPQAIKIIKTKNTKGISLIMYICFTIGVLGWTGYGFFTGELSIGIANAFILVFASIILTFKIINSVKGVDKNVDHN